MLTEIIIIGDELVSGKTRDLNGWYASGSLISCGLEVHEITTVGDNYDTLSGALRTAVKRSRFVIITGGLGPTDDDLTAQTAAKVLDKPLSLDQGLLDHIKKSTESLGLPWSPNLEKLAWLPRGAKVLDPKGYACGFSVAKGASQLYFLPGVPAQMREMMDQFVVPDILSRYRPSTVPHRRILKVFGLSESQIADVLSGVSDELKRVMFGFYPSFPETHVTITIRGKDVAEIEGELTAAENQITTLLDPYVFASGDKTLEAVVGEQLKARNMTLSLAESCTGGLIGHRLTSVSGSSVYFERGAVVYSDRSKVEMLGVQQHTLDTYGAVSDQTVREMAEGIRRSAKTDMGLAVTGIAGPLGGSEMKPVGTVFIGLSARNSLFSGQYRFPGDRQSVKVATAEMALDWVRRYLHGHPFIPGI
ncbi:MAG: competence/damage-inducible protein A [Deltaproteobacteria bacterium]|nr:MAG: competence/damage-inducible protein A [Deltaproteobacteria bacterium]